MLNCFKREIELRMYVDMLDHSLQLVGSSGLALRFVRPRIWRLQLMDFKELT